MADVDIDKEFEIGTGIDNAMNRAFNAAVRLHRMHNMPMVLWENGRVVYVDAHDIPLPDDNEPRAANTENNG